MKSEKSSLSPGSLAPYNNNSIMPWKPVIPLNKKRIKNMKDEDNEVIDEPRNYGSIGIRKQMLNLTFLEKTRKTKSIKD
jgi:hypothetical protein